MAKKKSSHTTTHKSFLASISTRYKSLTILKKATLIVFLCIVFVYIIAVVAYNVGHNSSTNTVALANQSAQLNKKVKPIEASDVISLFNKERAAKGLSKLNENQELDAAASARAKDMVAKGYQDNTSHDPWAFITQAGYAYSKVSLQSAYGQKTAQDIITYLSKGKSSTFITNTSVSDMGVGVAPGKVNGQQTQMVVIYLASPKSTPQSGSQPAPKDDSKADAALGEQFLQDDQQAFCEKSYSNNLYTYQSNVLKAAGQLATNENEVYNEGTQQGWTFSAAIQTVNYDISQTNETLTYDWNTAMAESKPANGCKGSSNIPPLLLVPVCKATNYYEINDCITQTNDATASV